jgi:hypothetical protein
MGLSCHFERPGSGQPCCSVGRGGLQWFPLTLRDPNEHSRGVAAAQPALNRFLDALGWRSDATAISTSLLALRSARHPDGRRALPQNWKHSAAAATAVEVPGPEGLHSGNLTKARSS